MLFRSARHAEEVARRTGARVVVQLDEPSLPAVLAGRLPTPSGYGTVAAVEDTDAQDALRTVLGAVPGQGIVHCCAADPPIGLLRGAGAHALGIDLTLVTALTKAGTVDAIGQALDDGATLLLGVVPSQEPDRPITLRDVAGRAFELADRLGFPRGTLAERDRKSTRLNSSHYALSRMPSSA